VGGGGWEGGCVKKCERKRGVKNSVT